MQTPTFAFFQYCFYQVIAFFHPKTIPAFITPDCQQDKLQLHMKAANMTHAESAIVMCSHVRVITHGFLWWKRAELRFCQMKPLVKYQVLQLGDGGTIPDKIAQLNFHIPNVPSGHYKLVAQVTSNGTMQITALKNFYIRPLPPERLIPEMNSAGLGGRDLVAAGSRNTADEIAV